MNHNQVQAFTNKIKKQKKMIELKPYIVPIRMMYPMYEEVPYFIFGGMVFTVLYNYFSSAIRALGDSKTPLYALIVASIINVLLDFFFILNLKMGVFGAGLGGSFASKGFPTLLCPSDLFPVRIGRVGRYATVRGIAFLMLS